MDIYNIIEAFRENGLNTLDHSAELDEARLECIIASIYYALFKRLPSTNDIDVERCIVILTQWIMHAYDRFSKTFLIVTANLCLYKVNNRNTKKRCEYVQS